MKKILLWVLFAAFAANLATAQSAKIHPPAQGEQPSPEQLKLKPWPGKSAIPPAANPFGLPQARYSPIGVSPSPATPVESIRTVRAENGLPIFFEGKTTASGSAESEETVESRAIAYLASLKPSGIETPAAEFVARTTTTDASGDMHVRLDQMYQGVPVYGGEVIAHTSKGAFQSLNGRYYPTPKLATTVPALSAETAAQQVVADLGAGQVKTDWTTEERQLIGGQELTTELVIYHPNRQLDAERLAWHITIYPNLLRRHMYFVDTETGAIIHHYDYTCEFAPTGSHPADAGGPVTASGLDLNNVNRSFGAWMDGSTIYLEDASQPMFNAGASNMPGSPIGAIVSLDAKNTSPEVQSTFDYALGASGSMVFNNKNAVSAHWNAAMSYQYYLSTHSRNSINGSGGNIFSFYNVSEADGSSMENAYWNGAAMWYGNGGAFFKSLAGGLDVGGHELTHGVIEKTANLEYQYESGALNESFADVFAVCIDRDDWLIGEDIVQVGATPNNCLRHMQFPNLGSPAQPKHVSEQYMGTQDNGGVHINSGIPNRAFYEFANTAGVGIDKAEKVYYEALQNYLVKSSQFIDCRIAVIAASKKLYGDAVANAAANAFATVGIGPGQGGNYQAELNVNPGTDYVLCVTNNGQNLNLADGNGNILATLYNQGVASRPSVNDNGSQIVFVNNAGHIIGVDLVYSPFDFYAGELSFEPIWRSAAISKDGRFLAAVTNVANNRIYIQDLPDPLGTTQTFFLYNPTYSQSQQATGEVQYADVLEFDYTGEYLMYDAYNELTNNQGENLDYWDIGFLQFWENNQFADGANAFISKLYSGLQPRSSVGNPTFAKNAPFVIALDFIDSISVRNDVIAVNLETGDEDYLYYDNGELGWPSYNRLDNAVIYNGTSTNGRNIYKRAVDATRIKGVNDESLFTLNREWGTWFANGQRSLMVGTNDPAANSLKLSVAPNPTSDLMRLAFEAPEAGPVQVLVSDLLGRVVQQRSWDLPKGENQIEMNLQSLPAGTYAVQVLAGNTGAALKVVKQH
ncbi:MAG: M4 family metallopeptidase [Lewinellaceae bacterium]|nr:M4 family metallopeptidase [Lewinellaceae bacterium]